MMCDPRPGLFVVLLLYDFSPVPLRDVSGSRSTISKAQRLDGSERSIYLVRSHIRRLASPQSVQVHRRNRVCQPMQAGSMAAAKCHWIR